jgi:hypothetical protein
MGEDYWDLSDYDKENILIPLDKNEEGKWSFAKFGVHNTLLPFHSATRYLAEEIHNNITGRERIAETNLQMMGDAIDAMNKALPVPIPLTSKSAQNLISKDLWANAIMKMATGYDVFRDRYIITDKEREGSFNKEGLLNKDVPYIYKAVGASTGLSPARTQAALETFITSPSTNMGVGLAYDISSSLADKFMPAKSEKELGAYVVTDADKLMQSLTKRFVTKTEAGSFQKRQEQSIREQADKIGREAKSQDDEVKNKIAELNEKNKGLPDTWAKTKAEMFEFVKKNSPLVDEKRVISLMRSANKTTRSKDLMEDDIEQSAYSVRYSPSVNSKAEVLYSIVKNDTKKAEEILIGATQAGMSISDKAKVRRQYIQLLKEK